MFKRKKVYLNKEKHSSQIFRHLPLPARTSGRFGTLTRPVPLDLPAGKIQDGCSKVWNNSFWQILESNEARMWPFGRWCSLGSGEISRGTCFEMSWTLQHNQRTWWNFPGFQLLEVSRVLRTWTSVECRLGKMWLGKTILCSKQCYCGPCSDVL